MASYSFSSFVSSIREKSSQAVETLSSDFRDFTSIVQEDAAELAKSMRESVQETPTSTDQTQKTKHDSTECSSHSHSSSEGSTDGNTQTSSQDGGLSSGLFSSLNALSLESFGARLLHSADDFLAHWTLNNDDADTSEMTEADLSARRYRLQALQTSNATYLEAPEDSDTFKKWQEGLDDKELTQIAEEVLIQYPIVLDKRNELVPFTIDRDTFWRHYLYKASLLAAQEQENANLIENALDDEEEIGWDIESPKKGTMFGEEEEVKEDLPPTSTSGQSVASSDTESWIELDEKKTMAQVAPPPLSSSSAASSALFIPEKTKEEDRLSWGDESDSDKSKETEDWGDSWE